MYISIYLSEPYVYVQATRTNLKEVPQKMDNNPKLQKSVKGENE